MNLQVHFQIFYLLDFIRIIKIKHSIIIIMIIIIIFIFTVIINKRVAMITDLRFNLSEVIIKITNKIDFKVEKDSYDLLFLLVVTKLVLLSKI